MREGNHQTHRETSTHHQDHCRHIVPPHIHIIISQEADILVEKEWKEKASIFVPLPVCLSQSVRREEENSLPGRRWSHADAKGKGDDRMQWTESLLFSHPRTTISPKTSIKMKDKHREMMATTCRREKSPEKFSVKETEKLEEHGETTRSARLTTHWHLSFLVILPFRPSLYDTYAKGNIYTQNKHTQRITSKFPDSDICVCVCFLCEERKAWGKSKRGEGEREQTIASLPVVAPHHRPLLIIIVIIVIEEGVCVCLPVGKKWTKANTNACTCDPIRMNHEVQVQEMVMQAADDERKNRANGSRHKRKAGIFSPLCFVKNRFVWWWVEQQNDVCIIEKEISFSSWNIFFLLVPISSFFTQQ